MRESNWPVGLLASAVWLNEDPQKQAAMAIAIGYFESTQTNSPPSRLTVCGHIASKSRWRLLERRWPRVLQQEGLTAFNIQDLDKGVGEFAVGWRDNQTRTARLLGTLSRLTQQHILQAFACSMDLDDYDAINTEYVLAETVSGPYGVCAAQLMTRVRQWMANHRPDDLTLFVFEDGDVDHRQIARVLQATGLEGGEPVQVWRRQWIDELGRRRHFRPFEVCDLVATEIQRGVWTGSARRLACDGERITRQDLRRLCEALSVPRRRADLREAVLTV